VLQRFIPYSGIIDGHGRKRFNEAMMSEVCVGMKESSNKGAFGFAGLIRNFWKSKK
jgi:hypothetical protein